MSNHQVNCKEECVNGCILGDQCPNLQYLEEARKFLATKSMDDMLEIAASRFLSPPPQSSDNINSGTES
ncbi:MAG: hypothetical protein WCO45_04005 [Pseudanabaena sp. ELA607]|jgi:hypothetical protein